MTPVESTIGLVALVAVVAWVLRLGSRPSEPEASVDPVDRLLAEVSGVDPLDASEVVAVTIDGMAFVPNRNEVQLVPTEQSDEPGRSRSGLGPGDLIAARLRRGAPDFDPWRLEALGRDSDYRAWFFESEEAGRAALALLERHVVRPPRDPFGEPRPVTGEAFAEARRRDEETERALDAPDEAY